ncbi:MAG: DUF4139 domain-containing protein [Paludibacteraceae bacterium]|nr:DUF4139 domain-containing protein [Paludibacteraceae bacterium]
MKKSILMLFASVVVLSLMAQTPRSAQVKSAVVFLSGAQLTQTVTLNLQKGDNDVAIENLSPSINQSSLQVKIGGGVVISSYEYSIDYLSADKSYHSVTAISDSLQKANATLQTIEEQLATNKQMLVLLDKGVGHSMEVEQQNITTETIEKNLNYYKNRSLALKAEQTKLTAQQKDTKALISRLQQQLRQDANQNARRSGILKLHLNSPKTANVNAEIQYFTPSAYWVPSYELNVEKVNSPINVIMKAQVAQTTGLEWTNVRLTLSTATPSQNNTAPQFSTWFLRQQEHYKSYGTAAARNTSMLRKSAAVYDAAETELMAVPMEMAVEEDMETATVADFVSQSEQQLSVEYDIDLPYTILGNGKQQTIALLNKKIEDVEYTYYTAPKLDARAYLVAEVKNWQKLQLLDGRAVVTYNGTFFGETYLSSSTTDQALRLTLGEDKQIAVKREKIEDYTSTKIVGSEKRVTHGYKIMVKNNKTIDADIVVKEQYPVSTDKQIVCTLSDKISSPTTNDTGKGILTYNDRLKSGESREYIVTYTVKYPKDWDINL